MSTKPRIFDDNSSQKEAGKSINQFSVKKTNISLEVSDRNVSPFGGYKQMASGDSPVKKQGVSRGIFTGPSLKKLDSFNSSDRSINQKISPQGSFAEQERLTYSSQTQIFQDFLNNELNNKLDEHREQMMTIMNDTFRTYHDKLVRSLETQEQLKQSFKIQNQTMAELENKVGKFESNFDTVSEVLQNEYFKKNLDHSGGNDSDPSTIEQMLKIEGSLRNYIDQKIMGVEKSQDDFFRDFDELRDYLTQSVQITLEQYSNLMQQEQDDKISKLATTMNASTDEKIDKVIEILGGRVKDLERRKGSDQGVRTSSQNRLDISSSNQHEEIQELRNYIDEKIDEYYESYQKDFDKLQKLVSSKMGSPALKKTQKDEEIYHIVDNLKEEIESLKLGSEEEIEQLKFEKDLLQKQMNQYQNKIIDELKKIDQDIKVQQYASRKSLKQEDVKSSNASRDSKDKQGTNGQSETESLKQNQYSDLKNRIDILCENQEDIERGLGFQKNEVEGIKSDLLSLMEDLRNAIENINIGETKIRKLDEVVTELFKNFDHLQQNIKGQNDQLSTLASNSFPRYENLMSNIMSNNPLSNDSTNTLAQQNKSNLMSSDFGQNISEAPSFPNIEQKGRLSSQIQRNSFGQFSEETSSRRSNEPRNLREIKIGTFTTVKDTMNNNRFSFGDPADISNRSSKVSRPSRNSQQIHQEDKGSPENSHTGRNSVQSDIVNFGTDHSNERQSVDTTEKRIETQPSRSSDETHRESASSQSLNSKRNKDSEESSKSNNSSSQKSGLESKRSRQIDSNSQGIEEQSQEDENEESSEQNESEREEFEQSHTETQNDEEKDNDEPSIGQETIANNLRNYESIKEEEQKYSTKEQRPTIKEQQKSGGRVSESPYDPNKYSKGDRVVTSIQELRNSLPRKGAKISIQSNYSSAKEELQEKWRFESGEQQFGTVEVRKYTISHSSNNNKSKDDSSNIRDSTSKVEFDAEENSMDYRISGGRRILTSDAFLEYKENENEEGDDDEVEVEYQIDENGYLMDEDGEYVLDEDSNRIKLSEEQLEKLKANNLLE